MDINKANIEFAFKPNTWTNGSVEVTVSKKESKYDIQLSKDGTKWTKTNKMVFEENGTIYARLIDAIGRTSDYASRKIAIIDTEKPVVTSATTSTNTVRIKATDNAAGIVGYAVTTSNTAPTNFTTCNSTKSLDVTVENLKQGTTYYAWVKDAAGNVSLGKSTATGNVTALTISTDNANWSTSKTITIKAANSNYSNIRYTTNGTIPTSTTGTAIANGGTFTITSNCTIIAVAFDSTGQAGSAATNKVTTIDRSAPTIGSITGAFTIVSGNTGTIKLTSIADTGSGISGYHVNTTGTTPTANSSWTASTSSSISYSVKSAGTYYFWFKDNAGNISASKSCKVSIATAIAKVGNTYYSSIAGAINAISSSGTVTVLQDETEGIIIPSGKTITIDFNKKTHKGRITNQGTTTIKNGTVNYTGTNVWVIHNAGGTMTISNMTITDNASGIGCAVVNQKGTMNISNSTITSAEHGILVEGKTTTWDLDKKTIEATTNISSSTIKATGTNDVIVARYYAFCYLLDCPISGNYASNVWSKLIEVNRFSGGYDIKAYGTGTFYFPTWTPNNGQDDLVWHNASYGTLHNMTYGYFRVTKGEHKNETGIYWTHIYHENTGSYWAGIGVTVY